MIRVGGGYEKLPKHIENIGRFECIKIYKLMKTGDPTGKVTTAAMQNQPPQWSFS